MPTLDWIGKKAVLNHHNEVPFHLLQDVPELSVGDPGSGNLLVEADNLLALKALLPYYARQVKCIVIDPPYNTGNENWVYNDNVNSPEICAWLGTVVGAEGETLDRHDRWLCMMYPRLVLLHQMLREDGAIFVFIDDNEKHYLRAIMDEIFGPRNFITTVIWQKMFSPKNTARHFSESHDYILVYAKNAQVWRPKLIPRTSAQDVRYKNPDNDERGVWSSSDCSARNFYGAGTYPITCPSGRVIPGPPKGRYWSVSRENFAELDKDNRVWWGKTGNNMPRLKRFLTEVKDGVVPETIWLHTEVGNTQEAKKELLAACQFDDSKSVFITPKPTRIIKRILEIATDKESLIMDSFAGSGTTGTATMQLNAQDGGNRHYVLVEIDPQISRTVTATRLKGTSNGHTTPAGKTVEGLGGGFRYCRLGARCFDEQGRINPEVRFADLARHVYFTETGEPIPRERVPNSPKIGVTPGGAGIYLLYNGILKDKSADGGNVLTGPILENLPRHEGPRVIYGTACRISPTRRTRENIVFKQIPYAIRTQ